MNSTPDGQIAHNLSQSLATAASGLRQFKQNLIASKLEQASGSYIQLKTVLIQQRLWACNSSRTELDPLFAHIAAEADVIHAILAPYVELMRVLKSINTLSPSGVAGEEIPPSTESKSETLEHEIFRVLLTCGPCSVTTLSSKLKKGAKQIRPAVENLCKSNRVQMRRSKIHVTLQAASEATRNIEL